ncbi:hypothetical protein DB345_17770 [Spartobacteria bacterium LR76]|nr:hypothetical protein DB345_17770 [Spartobacteria bacterium LR76]
MAQRTKQRKGGSSKISPANPVPAADTSLSPRGGAKHRRMKESILACLREAGGAGNTTTEIARELGVLKSRVQSWFSSTGKKCAEVRKIGTGRWRFVD